VSSGLDLLETLEASNITGLIWAFGIESQMSARGLGLQLHSIEVSSAKKYESAFKEATKARSAAIAVTQRALASSNQKRIAELGDKESVAGDLSSGRLCRQWWFDVLRSRPGRTLQACGVDSRQDLKGKEARRAASRAADEV